MNNIVTRLRLAVAPFAPEKAIYPAEKENT